MKKINQTLFFVPVQHQYSFPAVNQPFSSTGVTCLFQMFLSPLKDKLSTLMQLFGLIVMNVLMLVNTERRLLPVCRSASSFAFQSLHLWSPCLPASLCSPGTHFVLSAHLSTYEQHRALILEEAG